MMFAVVVAVTVVVVAGVAAVVIAGVVAVVVADVVACCSCTCPEPCFLIVILSMWWMLSLFQCSLFHSSYLQAPHEPGGPPGVHPARSKDRL